MDWAYDFVCEQPIEAMLVAFNAAGPWQWQLRDSAVYGDYLNCRPFEHVRLRVHEYPSAGAYGVFTGLRNEGFSALIEMREGNSATRAEIDDVFRALLHQVGAADLVEIEPYD
jgi:hypothetical protein